MPFQCGQGELDPHVQVRPAEIGGLRVQMQQGRKRRRASSGFDAVGDALALPAVRLRPHGAKSRLPDGYPQAGRWRPDLIC
jgi:hypothetical protein